MQNLYYREIGAIQRIEKELDLLHSYGMAKLGTTIQLVNISTQYSTSVHQYVLVRDRSPEAEGRNPDAEGDRSLTRLVVFSP